MARGNDYRRIWIQNFWAFWRCKYTVKIAKWETIKVKFDEVSQSARRSISQQVATFLFQKVRADQTNLAVTSVLTLRGWLRVGVPLSSQRGRELSRGKNEKSVEIKKQSFRREALWTNFGGVKSTQFGFVSEQDLQQKFSSAPPPQGLKKGIFVPPLGERYYSPLTTNARWFKDS